MRTTLTVSMILGFLVSSVSWLGAHPHLNKVLTTTLASGVEVSVSYQTVPSNEDYVTEAAAGEFLTPRGPKLQLSTALTAGDASIPAGEYTVGVIKNGDHDFTLALIPGELGRGDQPDMSKAIQLESQVSSAADAVEHLSIDIAPGTGQMEGKVVLAVHYGSLSVEGALS